MNGRVFYWVGGASGDAENWSNYLNWAGVSGGTGGTAPGSSYPYQVGDIAIIDDNSGYNISSLGTNITIAALINLSEGTYYFGATDSTLTVGGMIVAGIYGENSGNVTGSAIFSGQSSINEATITGSAIFSGQYASNTSSITGSAIFSGSSTGNDGSVEDAIFSGSNSENWWNVNGNAIFSGAGSHNSDAHFGGFVYYSAIFSGSNSRNTGIVGYNSSSAVMVLSGSGAENLGPCPILIASGSGVANGGSVTDACIVLVGSTFTNVDTILGTLLPLTTFTNSGTLSGKKPLDVLSTGLF